ncbi:hypothetical protein AVEN_147134-1 [Araneus ventricosus]|uniref:Uncharacterized protein n=1 Tax=Araneus ventricosus TaxID=182803 RepID=A0A4Y2GHF6_ARAVE|nr:hypothetical protein AVEN_147134-1 [Araneus ventricosus]
MNCFKNNEVPGRHFQYGLANGNGTLLYACIGKNFQRGSYQITKCSLMFIRTYLDMNPSDAGYRVASINRIGRGHVGCFGPKFHRRLNPMIPLYASRI